MAQIKEGSIVKKAVGDEVIATVVDVSTKVDKVTGSSLVADTEIAKIHESGSDNQDLSGKVDNAQVLTDVPAGALFTDTVVDITGKVDKVTGKSLVLDTEITKLSAISGTNTGDQDLNGLMPISGGTFTGTATGDNNTSYTTSQLRNARIYADGATVPTLADGEIAFIYEV